ERWASVASGPMTGLADTAPEEAAARPPYLNREWRCLRFTALVLALAATERVPLLERAKFLAIFSQNLDEFFQVRVAGLMEQLDAGLRTTTADGLDLVNQLRTIRTRVDELVSRAATVFAKEIVPD